MYKLFKHIASAILYIISVVGVTTLVITSTCLLALIVFINHIVQTLNS